jgi:hypothetical protein
VRCVNGVSIGCRAVQPGTVIDRKPNATIGPQKHSQAPKPNGFFDSIGPLLTSLAAAFKTAFERLSGSSVLG